MGHLMTFQQVARFYAVTPRTVRNWAEKGAISVVRTPSGHPRVPASSCVAAEKVKRSETTANTRGRSHDCE